MSDLPPEENGELTLAKCVLEHHWNRIKRLEAENAKLRMSELPELTPEERMALETVDPTEVLGTWRQQSEVAMAAAIRWMRRAMEREAENAELRELLQRLSEWDAMDYAKSDGPYWRREIKAALTTEGKT